MKKNFLMAAVVVAMLATSCSNDSTIIEEPNGFGTEIKNPTYASFNFNLKQASTRQIADYTAFSPALVPATPEESAIHKSDLRLMIFDATTKALEHNAMITGDTETVLLSAGTKKIFVIANMGIAGDKLMKGASTVTLASFNTTTAAATSTLDDFYKVVFDAGEAQVYSIEKRNGGNTFDISPLHTLVSTPTLGLPMSNSNAIDYVLKAGITKDQAEDGNVATSTDGSNSNNRFNIKLDFLSAKAQLVVDVNRINGLQTTAVISDPEYCIKNLARCTNLVQNVPAGGVKQSFYHYGLTGSNGQDDLNKHFDQAANANIRALATTGTSWLYVPENTSANLLRSQSSFYALKLTYKPMKIVDVIKHEINGGDKVSFSYKTWDELKDGGLLGADNSYIYTTKVVEGIPAGTYFKNVTDLAQAAWINKNDKPISDGTFNQANANALITSADYKTFKGAESWYRMDIGSGTGASTVYGVLRGNAYTATVNNITGPGEPSEGSLFEKPEEPVSARTYINATITAATWTTVSQTGDLN